jgi:hypothetical protein
MLFVSLDMTLEQKTRETMFQFGIPCLLGNADSEIIYSKIFSSWFPPSHGFAATLGLELGIGKVILSSIQPHLEIRELM